MKGGAKNQKVICPDGEHEDYYNQIGIYKYYFEKATGKKVKETTFIFPEEFKNNFTVDFTNDDCIAIENKFKQSISDIKSYKFEPTYKDNACKWCQYKDFCRLDSL